MESKPAIDADGRASPRARGPASWTWSWRGVLPGLALSLALAGVALAVQGGTARLGLPGVSAVFVAVVLGVALGNLGGGRVLVPEGCVAGLRFTSTRVLRGAVILLGLGFGLQEVAETGAVAVLAILPVTAVAALSVLALARLLRLPGALAALIAVGTAICGNSAIVALAPAVDARQEDITFASATITLFGSLAMLSYPVLGGMLGMDDAQFGVFAGAGVHDSAQAIASGFAYSPEAGAYATVVKLIRTGFLIPILLVAGLLAARSARSGERPAASAWRAVPWFALGFAAMAAVRTVLDGIVGDAGWWQQVTDGTRSVALFMTVAAMVAVGAQTNVARLRAIGVKPFYVGLVASALVGVVAAVVARVYGPNLS